MRTLVMLHTLLAALAISALGAQSGQPAEAFRLPDADMISEDIAYDSAGDRFFVSSVHRGGVDVVTRAGSSRTFIAPGADSTWGMFAVGVDGARGALWTTTAAMRGAARYAAADSGRSAVLEYDLRTGALRRRLVAPDSGALALGDLTIARNGSVYVSDGMGSGVYAIDARASAVRVLVSRGTLRSPQTPALSADERTLFVPDYSRGIAAVDLASGAVHWLERADSIELRGIDGLYRRGGDLIAVQNGVAPNRIVRLALDAEMRRVEHATVLARGPTARDVTHAAFVRGDMYYITQSGWDRLGADGAMKPGGANDGPVVLRLPVAP